jgi:hypothetical protein
VTVLPPEPMSVAVPTNPDPMLIVASEAPLFNVIALDAVPIV